MKANLHQLNLLANTIRQDILDIAYKAEGPSHPGPALSAADFMTALYFHIMNIDPTRPEWADRDRLILSKGHACPVLYAALARKGYFPVDWLTTVRRVDSKLQGHPDMNKTPGVDMTSGSLGNGLSIGLGMALYLRRKGKNSRVFVILGDGEMQEGPVWEAAMAAPANRIDKLIAIIDYNHFQSCGSVGEVMPEHNLRRVWEEFGWNVLQANGHDMADVVRTLEIAYHHHGKPTCIFAHTIKGKGVSFMEHDNSWHQKIPSSEQYEQATTELMKERECL